ncbi:MAG: recombinase family protein [Eubacterium sp.]|nr:recombinase family protein [Eubacterium sp.]
MKGRIYNGKQSSKTSIFGYDRNVRGKFIVWEEQAEVVRYIFSTYACGFSLAFIADELKKIGIPSPTNKPIWERQIINNILGNEKYLGDEDYPQIIENEIFNKVIQRKHNNAYSAHYNTEPKV